MYCLSFDFKKAGCSNSAFYLTKNKILALQNDVGGSVVGLFTCNRGEIYFDAEPEALKRSLMRLGISRETLDALDFYQNEDTVRHLFEVVCGLHSAILGEDDIARQAKRAYAFSLENSIVSGEFNLAFQKAFSCAKRVKTQTGLSRVPVSYATLASREALAFVREHSLRGNVLLVGATGDLGRSVARDILSSGLSLTVTSRRNGEAPENYRTIDFDKRFEELERSDVIISATSCPHLVFDYDRCEGLLTQSKLFVDLAVPGDIDDEIGRHSPLLDMDYFSRLAMSGNKKRVIEAQRAMEIVGEETEKYFIDNYRRGQMKKYGLLSAVC